MVISCIWRPSLNWDGALIVFPGHQQPSHWQWMITMSFISRSNVLNLVQHLSVNNWYEMEINIYFLNKYVRKGANILNHICSALLFTCLSCVNVCKIWWERLFFYHNHRQSESLLSIRDVAPYWHQKWLLSLSTRHHPKAHDWQYKISVSQLLLEWGHRK